MIESIKALTKTRGFKLVASFVIAVAIASTPLLVGAQDEGLSRVDPGETNLPGSSSDGPEEIVDSIANVINIALAFVGIIAVVFLIIGGFRYITSQGSSDQVETAKSTILYALLGIVVIGVSFILVNLVINIILEA